MAKNVVSPAQIFLHIQRYLDRVPNRGLSSEGEFRPQPPIKNYCSEISAIN